MIFGYDPVPVGRNTGNSSYAINLVKHLSNLYPEHEYRFLSIRSGRSKKAAMEVFGTVPNVTCKPVLLHPLVLGDLFQKGISRLNGGLIRFLASSFSLYHCTDPILFVGGIHNQVITIHDVHALFDQPWASPYEKKFYRAHLPAMVSDTRVIFCDSRCTRNDILKYFPAAEKKIKIVPLAANPCYRPIETDRNFLKKYGMVDVQTPFLLAVGVFPPRKNTLRFLNAYANLPGNIQKEMQVILIGHTGIKDEIEAVKNFIGRRRIDHHVTILSAVPNDDLVKFYNASYCMVYPSLYEGFGLPVLEAMACGCPVIASNRSSLPEVCGEAALYVDPYDDESITHALSKIISDADLRRRLSEASLRRNGEFSWKVTAEKTYEGYLEAVSSM